MKDVWKYAATGFMSLTMWAAADGAQASTTILASSIAQGTTYTYGETTFDFTSCSSACSNLELLGISNGRGGTEIEVGEASGSAIFSAGSSGQTLNFNLTIGTKTGTHGISQITNIVNGSDGGTTNNDGKVTSTLSAITGTGTVTTGPGTLASQLNATQAVAASWPLQTASFSLTDTLAESRCSSCTLTLTSVALLLNPAPEPASIGLVITGLMGLTAARRRFGRRSKQ